VREPGSRARRFSGDTAHASASVAGREAGDTWCWGGNNLGQLGNGNQFGKPAPVKVPLEKAVDVVAAEQHSCALLADRTVWCWGNAAQGQLGTGSLSNELKPVPAALDCP
jgi:alpha-tubulin suppressor-like RCC1 family protein